MDGTILVATAGQGIVRSADDGASWHRLGLKEAIEFDGTVRSLAVDPLDPSRVLAGADVGMCLSVDGGVHFEKVTSPMDGMTVWSITHSKTDPKTVYAGTGAPSRGRMYRSDDGGNSWKDLGVDLPEFCQGVNRPRILTICAHPERDGEVWFGVEEGGAWRSTDYGETWSRVDTPESGINNSDIHSIAIACATDGAPTLYFVVTVNSIWESTDDGKTWNGHASKERFDDLYYTRTLQLLDASGDAMLVAVGDGTPGTRSKIYRSVDRGNSWVSTTLHTAPNSTVWGFGAHANDPNLLFAGTKYGHLLRSVDGGKSWFKDWRDFSEITAVAWTPYVADVKAHPQSIV